jgi:pimeloyl-ACP methyl ester carboxylesterase
MAPAKLAKQVSDSKDNANIVMIPNCGHSVMSESPDGVLDNLKLFIEANQVK